MSSRRERKASFHLDQELSPNQLNYSTNFMSYKGKKTLCMKMLESGDIDEFLYRCMAIHSIDCCSNQNIIFACTIYICRNKLDTNQPNL